MTSLSLADRLGGALLGTAIGDAIGLPFENLSRRRVERLLAARPLEHRFLFGRGMGSDDTEHACMVAQALLTHPRNSERFARSLAWRLRFWLLGAPAGIGFATLRSIIKLWLGFPPHRSGVFSAGNGPAMRAPLLGLWGRDEEEVRTLAAASTRITHSDPKATQGALAIALAARRGAATNMDALVNDVTGEQLQQRLTKAAALLTAAASARDYCEAFELRRGVSGYINDTVPAALFAFLSHPDDGRAAVEKVVRMGGDTDTTAAIVGGLVGATLGAAGFPETWRHGLWEWPRSRTWIEALGPRLAAQFERDEGMGAQPLMWPVIPLRNLFFLGVVLGHVGRRCLPPYG